MPPKARSVTHIDGVDRLNLVTVDVGDAKKMTDKAVRTCSGRNGRPIREYREDAKDTVKIVVDTCSVQNEC